MAQKSSTRHSAIESAAFQRHSGAITVLMNLMFVRHLIGVYHAFDGDVISAIVLGEIAHHNLSHLISQFQTPRELSEVLRTVQADRHELLLPTNAFSISQSTGIPRESVRRKIAGLLRRGWVVKDAKGNLFVSSSASSAFAEFNVDRVHDLLDTACSINTLLDDGPREKSKRLEVPDIKNGRKAGR